MASCNTDRDIHLLTTHVHAKHKLYLPVVCLKCHADILQKFGRVLPCGKHNNSFTNHRAADAGQLHSENRIAHARQLRYASWLPVIGTQWDLSTQVHT